MLHKRLEWVDDNQLVISGGIGGGGDGSVSGGQDAAMNTGSGGGGNERQALTTPATGRGGSGIVYEEMDVQMAADIQKGIVPDPVHTNEMNAKVLEMSAQPPEVPAAPRNKDSDK